MSGIDPSIVVKKIPTYPNAKPIHQQLHLVHPRKVAAIKAKVEKLLKASFIYPIPLIDWVSNIVPMTNKQGTIRVNVDYHDINRSCLKDNYLTPFIYLIIDECAGSEIFSFMDYFSSYNQINISQLINTRPPLSINGGLYTETRYAHVKKLALAVIQVVQRFRHYILLCTTTLISDCNPMTYILTHQLLGGKYSKWIVILREFDLVFTTAKSKKSLVFAELIWSFPSASLLTGVDEKLPNGILFLIITLDP